MNRVDIEGGVTNALKEAAAHVAKIELDRPLEELGLDSMALLQLLTGLEQRFGVEFGDEMWEAKGQVTPGHLVDWISKARPSAPPPPAAAAFASDALERLKKGLTWRADALSLYRKVSYCFLSRDLDRPIPELNANVDLEYREVDPKAFIETAPGWAGLPANLRRWASQGFILITSWHRGELAATDWLTPAGDDEISTGLRIRCAPDSCFGLGLFENPALAGRGVGLAMAARSLVDTKRRGYRRQTTMVHVDNAPMLTASSQLLGFERVGRVDTVALLGRPQSRWTVGHESGVGGEVRF